jgi:hypothetical protein
MSRFLSPYERKVTTIKTGMWKLVEYWHFVGVAPLEGIAKMFLQFLFAVGWSSTTRTREDGPFLEASGSCPKGTKVGCRQMHIARLFLQLVL